MMDPTIANKFKDMEVHLSLNNKVLDKHSDDLRRFEEKFSNNYNTLNEAMHNITDNHDAIDAIMATLKQDMAHTKETLDNVNNNLQALLHRRHHSSSSRSSRTHSSR